MCVLKGGWTFPKDLGEDGVCEFCGASGCQVDNMELSFHNFYF